MSVKFSQQNEEILIEEVEENNDELSKEDENRFNMLCDCVINCMALVQNSHSELMEFKSILMKENVAPSLLVKLSLITGLVFRSVSDLHNPLRELVRLVKVYSESWEQKSKSLRKLHKGYEIKKGQLNVALKKLAIQNEKARRVEKKEVLQNWELLFSRAQLSRNHGRRWKYRMYDFKLKAQKGIDHLQDYFQDLLDEDDGVKVKIKHEQLGNITHRSRRQSQVLESLKFSEVVTIKDTEEDNLDNDEEYQESLEEKEEAESAEPIETSDVSVGTSDMNYTQTLIMRVYNPKGLEMFDNVKCRVIYGDKIYETNYLDKSRSAQDEEERIEKESSEQSELTFAESNKSKKGLIGHRKNKQKDNSKSVEEIRKDQTEKRLRYLARNEELKIPVHVEVTSGINKNPLYQSLKVTLFVDGKPQNKISQATIDLEELQAMEIEIFKEAVYKGDLGTPPSTPEGKPFPNLEPMPYPVYEYQEQTDMHETPAPMGQIPISFFWSRKEEQVVFHRAIETESIIRVVEELTGINLDIVKKEDLIREKIDESISPRPTTPLPAMILKSDYDALIMQHEEDITLIQNKYQQQMIGITIAKELIKEKEVPRPKSVYHKDCCTSPIFPIRSLPGTRNYTRDKNEESEKPRSSKSLDTLSTSGPDDQDELIYVSPEEKLDSDNKYQNYEDYTSSHKIGQNVSKSIVERVSIYSLLPNHDRDDLTKKVKNEVSKVIEDKLADLFKLHDDLTDDDVAMALADMCFPAVFMPFSNSSGTIYNPRAHQYFHPASLRNLRLSQPPSIFKLPPIKQSQMSILNLFDIGNELNVKKLESNPVNTTVIRKLPKNVSAENMRLKQAKVASEFN